MTDEQAGSGNGRVDEIIGAYLEELAAGRPPNRDDLLARHPDLAEELSRFFADHDAVQQLAKPPVEQTAGEPPTVGPDATSAPQPSTAIRSLVNYELLEEIARGGMGIV
jgi:hypothetical protein